mgnify:CR=1 FL=1
MTDTDATPPRSRPGGAWLLAALALAAAALAAWQSAPRLSAWWTGSAEQVEPSPLDDRLAADPEQRAPEGAPPLRRFFVTDAPGSFADLASRFLGRAPEHLDRADLAWYAER